MSWAVSAAAEVVEHGMPASFRGKTAFWGIFERAGRETGVFGRGWGEDGEVWRHSEGRAGSHEEGIFQIGEPKEGM
jgi:hypothetical protein